jgi:hypothetical protein
VKTNDLLPTHFTSITAQLATSSVSARFCEDAGAGLRAKISLRLTWGIRCIRTALFLYGEQENPANGFRKKPDEAKVRSIQSRFKCGGE